MPRSCRDIATGSGYRRTASPVHSAARFVPRVDEQSQLFSFLTKFFVWKDPPYHTRLLHAGWSGVHASKRLEALPTAHSGARARACGASERQRARSIFSANSPFHLPVIVIAEYLGIPKKRARNEVREWSEDLSAVIFVRGGDTNRMQKGEIAMRKLVDFLRPILRERQTHPKDDLISAMVSAEQDGTRLSEDEIIAAAVLMVFGGHETTMNLLANGVVAFNRFPDEWQRLRNNGGLVRTATEEILRFDGPIRGQGRWAKEPLVLGSQAIAEKDRVFLIQHAANRDPAAFTAPDALDIGRSPNRHAAFGQGIHSCLGAPLARMEAQEAFSYLAEQFERIEVLDQKLEYNPTMVSRSLQRLNVRFHAA